MTLMAKLRSHIAATKKFRRWLGLQGLLYGVRDDLLHQTCALSFYTAVQDFEVEWRRETMVGVAREGLVETPDVRRRR